MNCSWPNWVFVIFSEYFCSEATKARSRLTNENRKTAHVVSAVPGCSIRSHGLVASGLDMQHLGKAQSWYKFRWAAQQQFITCRDEDTALIHYISWTCSLHWRQEACSVPPGFSGRRIPLRGPSTLFQGTDAAAARSYRHHSVLCCRSCFTRTVVFLRLEISLFGAKLCKGYYVQWEYKV